MVILCAVLLSACIATCEAAPDYRFHPQTLRLAADLKAALVKHKICATPEHCSNARIVFVTPESWGMEVAVYGVTDKAVLQELTNTVTAAFFAAPAGMSIQLKVYSHTKAQALSAPLFRKLKPAMEMKWENRNADR